MNGRLNTATERCVPKRNGIVLSQRRLLMKIAVIYTVSAIRSLVSSMEEILLTEIKKYWSKRNPVCNFMICHKFSNFLVRELEG
jgi:hypothetical protein